MEIGPLSNQQPEKRAPEARKVEPEMSPEQRPPQVGDRLEISNDARARLGQLADSELRSEQTPPTPVSDDNLEGAERIEAIKKRIESGYYQRMDVSGMIAEKFLDDLDG